MYEQRQLVGLWLDSMTAHHKICVALLFGVALGRAIEPHALAQSGAPENLSTPAIAEVPETGPLRTRPRPQLEAQPSPATDRLRISGEFREQIESWRNREFGLIAEQDDTYLLQRAYVRADYDANGYLTTTIELGSSLQFDSPFEPSPIDEDPAYVQQLFADVLLIETNESKLHAKFGRQTFSLGSGRLVATRNGPNVRRSFDAARLIWESERFESQVLFASDVITGDDAFDNEPQDERMLWGVYSTIRPERLTLPASAAIDTYYLGYRNRNARFDSVAGDEVRHSLGARFFGTRGDVDFNIEPIVQFGRIEEQDVLAWTAATIVGKTFRSVAFEPRLGLKFDVISGDDSPGGKLQTFNALFPNNSYFSEAAIFAPANLIDLNLNAELKFSDKLRSVILWDFLWRYDVDDGIYVPPGVPAIAGASSDNRYIGNTISVSLEYQPSDAWEITAAYVHLTPGAAVESSGGGDVDFAIFWTTWYF